jgi:Protein tyrosine kinase.
LLSFTYYRGLRHPHLLQVYFRAISIERKYNILVTEPISEGNLYHVMYDLKQKLTLMQIKKIVERTFFALLFLHAKNIVHNFLNSTSLYISRDWKVKIGNFEYAHQEEKPYYKQRVSVAVEEFHFPYLAPELHSNKETIPNRACDMYR